MVWGVLIKNKSRTRIEVIVKRPKRLGVQVPVGGVGGQG